MPMLSPHLCIPSRRAFQQALCIERTRNSEGSVNYHRATKHRNEYSESLHRVETSWGSIRRVEEGRKRASSGRICQDSPVPRSPCASCSAATASSSSSSQSLHHRRFRGVRAPGAMGGGGKLPLGGSTLANEDRRAGSSRSTLLEGDAILIVDHGSRRAESNAMLHEFVKMYKEETCCRIVEAAHMELAVPTISDAFGRCVEQGAKRVIVSPYFLFPGRHWEKDIPALVSEASKKHPEVPYVVTAPIGLHELMVTVIQDRMEYCLSQVVGEVSECDMCKGSGRCRQLTGGESHPSTNMVASSTGT